MGENEGGGEHKYERYIAQREYILWDLSFGIPFEINIRDLKWQLW